MEGERLSDTERKRRDGIRQVTGLINDAEVVSRLVRSRSDKLDFIGRTGTGSGSYARRGILLAKVPERSGRRDGINLVVTENGVRQIIIGSDWASGSTVVHFPDDIVPDRLFEQGECLGDVSAEDFRNNVVNKLSKFSEEGGDELQNVMEQLRDLKI